MAYRLPKLRASRPRSTQGRREVWARSVGTSGRNTRPRGRKPHIAEYETSQGSEVTTMAKLISLEEWRIRTFEADAGPSKRAVYNWANNGFIPGARKIGGLWFVDPDKVKQTTGNPLVDRVLQAT